MGKKLTNLNTALPRCRYCQRYWQPDEGVVATKSFCSSCSELRRSFAANHLGLRPLSQADGVEGYILPRSLR